MPKRAGAFTPIRISLLQLLREQAYAITTSLYGKKGNTQDYARYRWGVLEQAFYVELCREAGMATQTQPSIAVRVRLFKEEIRAEQLGREPSLALRMALAAVC